MILAIILPPLAVLLADGLGVHFLVDLIFWLLGYGFVVFIPGGGFIYLGIFGLIAIIYALLVIFEVI
ncbi:MAG: YqaE/Pmp3 family membrane protein [Bacteroidota bacterium]|nr:YqaE/Pmp3 family membrane protein [Bacteroidota bacterium]